MVVEFKVKGGREGGMEGGREGGRTCSEGAVHLAACLGPEGGYRAFQKM